MLETRKKILRQSLNLPSTLFPMRANAVSREPQLRHRIVANLMARNEKLTNEKEFLLHDGPPFANGALHMGHFLNKTLKDTFNRYKVLQGYKINYVPGWDCHGLPIEMKALNDLAKQEKKNKKKNPETHTKEKLTALKIRQISSQLAQETINKQQQDFIEWGVCANWNAGQKVENDLLSTYSTMSPLYEVRQYDILAQLLESKLIYRGFKPVFWSPSSQTALAESELEYKDQHISKSAYITFQCLEHPLLMKYKTLKAVIWTTTPWTIPANMALSVHPKVNYSVVKSAEGEDQYYLLATDLIEDFFKKLGIKNGEVVESLQGDQLADSVFQHPLIPSRRSVLLLGEHVTTDAGTGIVHTAPGHGQDDYHLWLKASEGNSSSNIICPVDEKGRYTSAVEPSVLSGLPVQTEGNMAVLDMLSKSDALLKVEDYEHRYPYDWRTKKPVILRATQQWFCKLDTLHTKCLEALENDVVTVPSSSKKRLVAALSSRDEWCISRQRSWGLPIPVFYEKNTKKPLLTKETIAFFQSKIAEKGSNLWWELPTEELLPPSILETGIEYEKGFDTLDVWFDSGSSWYSVLKKKRADVYVEGSDQHRGWFQSSLLTSMATANQPPYKNLITHGFVLDEKNMKMSKSVGNVLTPNDFILGGKNKKKNPAYGVDVLRYWVATTDYTKDVTVGPQVVEKVSTNFRKVRNTARFLLGNLADFDPTRDTVPYDDLPFLEKYMLHMLRILNKEMTDNFDNFNVARAQSKLMHFLSTDLSSFYMEISKDCLYCSAKNGKQRRSIQTVLYEALNHLTVGIAPVACHTAEDIHLHRQSQIEQLEVDQVTSSVFEQGWLKENLAWENDEIKHRGDILRELLSHVQIGLEKKRTHETEAIGSSLEAQVSLYNVSPAFLAIIGQGDDAVCLADLFGCSQVNLSSDQFKDEKDEAKIVLENVSFHGESITICVDNAKGKKCPRCWKFCHEISDDQTLCTRCAQASGYLSLDNISELITQE